MTPTYKLIMLDTPIIVSSDKIKENDYCLMFDDFGNIFSEPQQYLGESKGHFINKGHCKIISGLPNQKQIDWNGFEKELGYIDVFKLAKQRQPKQFQIEVEETENSFKIVKVL